MWFQCNSAERKSIIFSTSDLGLIQIQLKHHQSKSRPAKTISIEVEPIGLAETEMLKEDIHFKN